MMDFERSVQSQFDVFYKQQDALDFQKTDPTSRVFAFEMKSLGPGPRHFICTQPDKFYKFYKSTKSGRYFYELIRDGSPCRPYFDLEFHKEFNPTLDSLAVFQDFISVCKETFVETLNVHLKDTDFIVLDSSTDEKFSAHVIVHLPDKKLFPSNAALKPLVQFICGKMLDSRKCIVQNGKDEDFLCDRSVYSKNRQFRLLYSSKFKKNVKLVYASYWNSYVEKPSSEQRFFDTLVVPKDLDEYQTINMGPLLNICRASSHNVKMPNSYQSSSYQNVQCWSQPDSVRILVQGYGTSMFPELDDHILSLMRPLCPGVRIRKWELVYCKLSCRRRIVYYFFNCRFCYNILREHQSQNVYWIVEFDNVDFVCYQKCFDYQCRHFKSQWFQIPCKIEEKTKKKADEVFSSFGIEPPPKPKCKQNFYELLVTL